jgi:hypothetical protein
MKSLSERFWSHVDKNGPIIRPELGNCWIWVGSLCNGYGQIRINGKTIKTHRLAWILDGHELPEDADVLHECDNPPCVRQSHLFLGNQSINNIDMYSKHRENHGGCHNSHAKLTESKVLEIKYALDKYCASCKELAEIYNIPASTISHINCGYTWKYLCRR